MRQDPRPEPRAATRSEASMASMARTEPRSGQRSEAERGSCERGRQRLPLSLRRVRGALSIYILSVLVPVQILHPGSGGSAALLLLSLRGGSAPPCGWLAAGFSRVAAASPGALHLVVSHRRQAVPLAASPAPPSGFAASLSCVRF